MYEFLITGIKNSLHKNSFCISQIMTGTFAHLFLDQHMEVVEVAIATVRLWHLFLISTSLSCTHCKHGVSLPRILVRFLHHSCCQKQYGTKFRNPSTEHALQGGKKVIYNLNINIFKLIYGLKLLVFKHYIALGDTWMEYNVPVCEINAVIAVSVVTGESDLDLGSEVSSEESSIYK